MGILTGVTEFFGLDIGTTAIRVVELHGGGKVRGIARYGSVPVEGNLAQSDANADQQRLVQFIKQAINDAKINTRNVAVGVPSNRVFTTVIDIDKLSPEELTKTIRFQADSLIPTAIEDSKIDWALLGDSPKEQNKVEILLSSVTNDFIEKRLDLLESIGLNVIAFEPESLALTRALLAPDMATPQMVLDIGSKSTDLVIAMNGAPRLTRSMPIGTDALVKAAMQNLSIDEKQATQFVFKFGLSKDKLEGQIYAAIGATVDILLTEIEKSIKFFQARYSTVRLERIIVSGGASALPEFPLFIANKFGVSVEIGNAWRNVAYPQEKENELLSVSNHFAIAAGLAERVE
ncbi:type IV pilus assembly protein PilM [bacterium]|nr:type IV pilus assembly protein PilM [bacterium]NDG32346.1 type IV pilus assembly protein PilM [bacterium]